MRQSKAYRNYTRQSPEYRRVCGFNHLLQHIYGQPVHLSNVLLRRGVPAVELFRWRGDKGWLPRYLRRLRLKLMVLLRNARPTCDPFVLNAWYALDGEGQSTRTAIAETLKTTTARVDEMYCTFLAYLRSAEGRAALEKVILDAAREIEPGKT